MGSVVAGGGRSGVGMGELRQPNRQIGGAERRRVLRNRRMRRLMMRLLLRLRVLLLMRKCVTRRGRRIEIATAAAAHPTGCTRARTAAVEHIHCLDVERKQSAQQRGSHLLGGRRGIGALGGERVLEL